MKSNPERRHAACAKAQADFCVTWYLRFLSTWKARSLTVVCSVAVKSLKILKECAVPYGGTGCRNIYTKYVDTCYLRLATLMFCAKSERTTVDSIRHGARATRRRKMCARVDVLRTRARGRHTRTRAPYLWGLRASFTGHPTW